jgi:hypothetical protein
MACDLSFSLDLRLGRFLDGHLPVELRLGGHAVGVNLVLSRLPTSQVGQVSA